MYEGILAFTNYGEKQTGEEPRYIKLNLIQLDEINLKIPPGVRGKTGSCSCCQPESRGARASKGTVIAYCML